MDSRGVFKRSTKVAPPVDDIAKRAFKGSTKVVRSVGDIIVISNLAGRVYTAYKDTPGDYNHITKEVQTLRIIINKVVPYFESAALSSNDLQEGWEALESCQSVFEDLKSLIENYGGLASSSLAATRLEMSGSGNAVAAEDIATLRARLISNTSLLNSFIQSCELLEMQAQMTDVHSTNSSGLSDSIPPTGEDINTKKAYKRLLKRLYPRGATAEVVSQKGRFQMFKAQNSAIKNPIDVSSIEDQGRLLGVGCSSATTLRSLVDLSTIGSPPVGLESGSLVHAAAEAQDTEHPILVDLSTIGSPPVGLESGSLVHAAAEAQDTEHPISTDKKIQGNNFAESFKENVPHKAVQNDHADKVQPPVKHSTLFDIGIYNHAALHLAAQNGRISTVELLLEEGAPIEAIDQDNHTPLHLAAWNSHIGMVELLLRKGASIEAIDQVNNTPLHLAVRSGHTGMVELLLRKGASVEALDQDNNTPLHLAVWTGHTDVAELLLRKGASIEAIDHDNNSPLHLAVWSRHTGMAELLLRKGASVEAIDQDNNTPLHLAVWTGHTDMAELLLRKGASIEAIDQGSRTPLHLAVRSGHTGMVELLLRKGASIRAIDKDNNTLMHHAAWNGDFGTVELLLKEGSSIQAINKFNHSPLHLATLNGHSGVVELLVGKDAPIEAINGNNYTQTQTAAQNNHTDTVKLLTTLQKGKVVSTPVLEEKNRQGRYGQLRTPYPTPSTGIIKDGMGNLSLVPGVQSEEEVVVIGYVPTGIESLDNVQEGYEIKIAELERRVRGLDGIVAKLSDDRERECGSYSCGSFDKKEEEWELKLKAMEESRDEYKRLLDNTVNKQVFGHNIEKECAELVKELAIVKADAERWEAKYHETNDSYGNEMIKVQNHWEKRAKKMVEEAVTATEIRVEEVRKRLKVKGKGVQMVAPPKMSPLSKKTYCRNSRIRLQLDVGFDQGYLSVLFTSTFLFIATFLYIVTFLYNATF